ncbi:265_t:CDS:2, partial [Racocetra persica]
VKEIKSKHSSSMRKQDDRNKKDDEAYLGIDQKNENQIKLKSIYKSQRNKTKKNLLLIIFFVPSYSIGADIINQKAGITSEQLLTIDPNDQVETIKMIKLKKYRIKVPDLQAVKDQLKNKRNIYEDNLDKDQEDTNSDDETVIEDNNDASIELTSNKRSISQFFFRKTVTEHNIGSNNTV